MRSRRILWGTFAILSFLMMIVMSYAVIRQWKVYSQGKIVDVTIVQLPSRYARHGTLKFEYEGKRNTISMEGNTALRVGDSLQLKYLESEHMFKFPNDNPLGWGIFDLLLFLGCGIYCVTYAFRTDSPAIKM
jgi:hypothetical protein